MPQSSIEIAEINLVLDSVLKQGKRSRHLTRFIKMCQKISIINLINSKYRDFLLKKTGCRLEDIALDLIADLFEEREGKFYQLNLYFTDILDTVKKIPEDVLHSKLVTLVRSGANQKISDIRQDFGECYFRVKKAVNICLTRKAQKFKKKVVNDSTYIYHSEEKDPDLSKLEYPQEQLLPELFKCKFKTYQVPEVMNNIYSIVNEQDEYSKALELNTLTNCVVGFYKRRLDDVA